MYLNIFKQVMSLSLVRRHQSFVYVLTKKGLDNKQRGKNAFLRCEDLRVSWDLKGIRMFNSVYLKLSQQKGLALKKINSVDFLSLKDTINPLKLFVEKREFFNQNKHWLNNIIYH